MSKSFTMLHNPRCSKSRQTLELLRSRGVEPKIVDYLKVPPSVAELQDILRALGLEARDLLRKNEPPYKELGLMDPSLDEVQLLQAVVEQPILLQRPIVICGKRAVIGRPPENVLDLLP